MIDIQYHLSIQVKRSSSQPSQLRKNIKTRVYKLRLPKSFGILALVFNVRRRSFRIHSQPAHLFSSPVRSSSSVAATLPPQTPKRQSWQLVPHSIPENLMGCHRRLCLARLLNRSGCGFVTVFERLSLVCIVPFVPSVSKHVQFPLRYTFTVVKSIHSLHSVPTLQSFHTLETIPLRKSKTPPNPCAYCIGHSHSLPAVLLSHLRSTRSRLATFHSASLHCFPSGIHSTCFPHSKKPMKIFIIAKDFVDEVSFFLNINNFKRLLFVFPTHGSRLFYQR